MTKKPLNLLFLCMGSTCRSPMMAALYMRAAVPAGRADNIKTAGWSAALGDVPSMGAINAMKKMKLDIDLHRAVPLSADLVNWADKIVTADNLASGQIRTRFRYAFNKVVPLGLFSMGNELPEIKDPAGKGQFAYDMTAEQIDALVKRLVEFLNSVEATPGDPVPLMAKDPAGVLRAALGPETRRQLDGDLEESYQKTMAAGKEYLKWMMEHPEVEAKLEDIGSSLGAYLLNSKHGKIVPGKTFNIGQLTDAFIIGFFAGYWQHGHEKETV